MKARNVKFAALAAALTAVVGVGGIMAYLTDTDNAVNNFKLGKVDIEETEPNWDPDPDGVTPNMELEKDPTVVNKGNVDAFVFQAVSVPVADVVTVNEDGTKNEKAEHELFEYTVAKEWYEIGHRDVTNGAGKVVERIHLYAYGSESAMTVLAPEDSTPAVFSTVRYINVIEGSTDNNGVVLDGSTQQVDVTAYGIQTSDINGDITDPEGVWSVYANQNDLAGDVYSK